MTDTKSDIIRLPSSEEDMLCWALRVAHRADELRTAGRKGGDLELWLEAERQITDGADTLLATRDA
jgi:hypothetical protein